MAGYETALADGGAIPDDQGESYSPDEEAQNTPMESGQSGAIPDDQSQPQPAQHEPASRSGADFNAANVPANAKRILQYLLGADAAPQQALDKFARGAKAEHPELSDDDANLVAVLKAHEQGGPDAAHAMLQANRVAYNYKASVANAALNGADGKAADPQQAADAMTEASKHVLDGSQARFVASPDGNFTATVKMPGSDQRQSYNLTPDQFRQLANVGGDGQFDRLLGTGGIPMALQRITAQASTAPQGGPSASQETEDRGTQAPEDQTRSSGQVAPIEELDKGEQQQARETGDVVGQKKRTANSQFDDDLVARANQLYPWISQGAQRNRFLVQTQEQRDTAEAEQKNKLNVAKEQGTFRVEGAKARAEGQVGAAHERAEGQVGAAQVRADSYAKAQQQKAQIALQQMAQRAQDAAVRNRINVGMRLINNPNWATQSADERNAILKAYGLDQLMEPVSPSTQSPQTPPAAAKPNNNGSAPHYSAQNLPPPGQRQVGATITTAKGTFQWTGQGWQQSQ
jgi:hypothetical protein